MEVGFGQGQVVGKGTRMPDDPEYGSFSAMTSDARNAPFAGAAGNVDLTDNPLPDQFGMIGFHNLADKLMPGNTREPVVAALQFEIGIADPGEQKADQGKTWRPQRQRSRPDGDPAGFNVYSVQVTSLSG